MDIISLIVLALFVLPFFAGYIVWYLWAMARLFPRIGLDARDGWIPFWNVWKLIDRTGLPGWTVLLQFVGFGLVTLVFRLIACFRIGEQVRASGGYVVLAYFLPPLWATLLANHIDAARGGVPAATAGAAPASFQNAPVNYAPPGAMPPVPAQPAPAQPVPAQPTPTPTLTSTSTPTPTPAQEPAPVSDPQRAPFAPPLPPLPTPASAAITPTGISGVHPPLPIPAPDSDPAAPAESAATPDRVPALEDSDRTLVVPRALSGWVLELPDGTVAPLARDSIVGRRPVARDGATAVALADSTRTLSKEHARLRLRGAEWTIEDLDSTNGVVMLNEDGSEAVVSPGESAVATSALLLGKLQVTLRREGDAA